jgi:uncharacterized protein YodC (DUF2158 family)
MADAFVGGDVVRLKSGGPHMTLVNYDNFAVAFSDKSERKCLCKWFEGAKAVEGTFFEHELEKVEKANKIRAGVATTGPRGPDAWMA